MSVAIAGVAELPQGRSQAPSPMALHEQLVRMALADAGLALEDVDALLTVSPRSDPYLIHAAALAERLRIRPSVALTLEAGGAAPMAMVETARAFIASGRVRNAVVVAADMPNSQMGRSAYQAALADIGPVHPDFERPFGPTVPSLFALVAQRYMCEYGATELHLAAVALQDRKMAGLHPNAHYREPLTLEQYLTAPQIAQPLRLYDCAPVSDGGGAAVLVPASHAKALLHPVVEVVGAGFATGHMHLSFAESLTAFTARVALRRALEEARLPLSSVDVALIYDCFTIAMLINLEDMGFAERGQAGPAFAAGEFSLEGRLPVNPHGGLLSHGHPGRAGGMGNLIEAVLQLRGAAGPRQVPNAEIALVHGMGGVFATHGVLLLRRGE